MLRETPQAFAEHRRIPQSRTGRRQPAALGSVCIPVPLHGDADAQRRRAASCGKCLRAAQRREFLPHPFGASIAVDRRSRRHARVSFCSLPLFWTSKRRGVAHQRETSVPSKSHTKTHNPTMSRLPTSCMSAAMSDYALSANPTYKTVPTTCRSRSYAARKNEANRSTSRAPTKSLSTRRSTAMLSEKPKAFAEHRRIPQS